jgi:hypothetical protein
MAIVTVVKGLVEQVHTFALQTVTVNPSVSDFVQDHRLCL